MSGPGAGGIETASAVLGDVVSILAGEAPVHQPQATARDRPRHLLLLLPPPRGRRPARRPRPDRRRPRPQRDLGRSRRPARPRRRRPPGHGHARVPGGRASPRRRGDRRARLHALAAPRDPGDRGGVRLERCRQPLIERYRDRLPLEPGDPVVTLNEGSTPLIEAPRALREGRRAGAPQARGREPDRLLQGPRHDGRGLAGEGRRAPRR